MARGAVDKARWAKKGKDEESKMPGDDHDPTSDQRGKPSSSRSSVDETSTWREMPYPPLRPSGMSVFAIAWRHEGQQRHCTRQRCPQRPPYSCHPNAHCPATDEADPVLSDTAPAVTATRRGATLHLAGCALAVSCSRHTAVLCCSGVAPRLASAATCHIVGAVIVCMSAPSVFYIVLSAT